MTMFATDLDRTLIYSKRALVDFKQDNLLGLMPVERKDDQNVAFMTKRANVLLKELVKELLFVPVTTRTYEQFMRIFLFSEEISLTYAVTSNGANIIYKGTPLIEWRNHIQNKLNRECTNLTNMLTIFENVNINGYLKIAENLFFYYILEDELSDEELKLIKSIALHNGWRVSIQGKKLYVMPNPISKGEAIKYIKERQGIQTIYGAGDSVLDYDFLNICDFAFVPSHGELVKERKVDDHFIISKEKGIKAGEEILNGLITKPFS